MEPEATEAMERLWAAELACLALMVEEEGLKLRRREAEDAYHAHQTKLIEADRQWTAIRDEIAALARQTMSRAINAELYRGDQH